MDTRFRLLRHDREQAECDHREEKISFHSKYSLHNASMRGSVLACDWPVLITHP
jgi:hypothetical protein